MQLFALFSQLNNLITIMDILWHYMSQTSEITFHLRICKGDTQGKIYILLCLEIKFHNQVDLIFELCLRNDVPPGRIIEVFAISQLIQYDRQAFPSFVTTLCQLYLVHGFVDISSFNIQF